MRPFSTAHTPQESTLLSGNWSLKLQKISEPPRRVSTLLRDWIRRETNTIRKLEGKQNKKVQTKKMTNSISNKKLNPT